MKTNRLQKLKVRWRVYFYGVHILEAMMLDNILDELKMRGMLQFSREQIPDQTDKDINENINFLISEGYITDLTNQRYEINQKGKLLLANGGFTTEAKKNKNALFAFRISLAALLIAAISFFSGIFHWFRYLP